MSWEPLNAIIGCVRLVSGMATAMTGKKKWNFRAGRSSSDSLAAVINDFLDISKIEAGKLLILEPLNLLQVLKEVVLQLVHIQQKACSL